MGLFDNDDGLQRTEVDTNTSSSTNPYFNKITSIGDNNNQPKEWEWKPLDRMEASIQNSFGSLWAAAGAVADTVGWDSARDWAVRRSSQLMEKAVDKELSNISLDEVDSMGDAGKWAVNVITDFVPDLALMALGGAGLGSLSAKAAATTFGKKSTEVMLRKGLEKNLVKVAASKAFKGEAESAILKEAIRATAKDAGALLGVSAIEGMQGAGQDYRNTIEAVGIDSANPWASLGVGAAQSSIAMFNPLNKVLAGMGSKSSNRAFNILKMTGSEAAEEMGQEIPAMMHEASLDPTQTFAEVISSDEGVARLIESGAAGALLGSAFGGVTHNKKKNKIEETKVDNTPTWQENMAKIKEDRELVTERPEVMLEENGIDTSEDIVTTTITEETNPPTDPDPSFFDFVKEPPNPVEPVVTSSNKPILSKDIPNSDIENTTYKEPVEDITIGYEPELPPTIQKKIEEDKGPAEPQWKSDQQKVRSINAAREIEKYFGEDGEVLDPPSADPEVVEIIKSTQNTNNTKTTNLVDKQKISTLVETIKAGKELDTDIKLSKEEPVEEKLVPTELPPEQQSDLLIDDEVAANRKELLDTKSTNENNEILNTVEEGDRKAKDGWDSYTHTVDGKEITSRVSPDGNSVAIKVNNRSWSLSSLDEDTGSRVDRGKFKSLKDAKNAYESGKDSSEFYKDTKKVTKKEARNKESLTEDQGKLLTSINIEEVSQVVMNKTKSSEGLPMASDAIADSIIDSSRTYNPNSKTTFKSYAIGRAIGAIKDLRKKTGIEVQDISEGGAVLNNAPKVDLEESTVVKKEKKKKEVQPPPPPVKKISIEEYKKLKEEEEEGKKKETKKEVPDSMSLKDEDEIEAEANEYTLTTDNSLEAIKKFDKDNTGELSDSKKEVRKLLEETLELDGAVGRKFTEEFKSGLDILNSVVNSDTNNKVVKHLAKFLVSNLAIKEKLKNTKVEWSKDKSLYSPSTNTITLSTRDAGTHLHEIVHAVTSNEMRNNDSLVKEIDQMMDIVKLRTRTSGKLSKSDIKLIESYKTSEGFKKDTSKNWGDNRGHAYALLNRDEFLAQAFSEKSFQDFLKTIIVEKPFKKTGRWTLWNQFVTMVGKAIGMKGDKYTMLEKIITIVPELSNVKLDKKKGGSKKGTLPTLESLDSTMDRDAQVKVMLENDTRDKPIKRLKDWGVKLTDFAKDIGKGVTERIRKIDHTLIKPLRKMEFGILEDNKKYQKEIEDFVTKYNQLNNKDKVLLDLTLLNREEEDISTRNKILKDNGMVNSYKKVEGVLDEIYKSKESVGLNNYKDSPGYFPRRVKDVRALMQTIKDDPTYNVIQTTLDNLGEDVSDVDKEKAIEGMINTGKFPSIALLDPSSSKKRTITRVSSKWKHHYQNSVDALVNHIYESNEAIHTRKLFGDTHRKGLVQKRDKLYKELTSKKLSNDSRKTKVGELQRIEAILEDTDTEMNDGISSMLAEKAPNLSTKDADEIIKLIRGRLMQKGTHGTTSTIRNVALMSVLSSPTSAITQIGDLAFSIYKYGPTNTVKAMLGDKLIRPEDLDLSGSMKEFQTEGTAKWLDKTLKWSGLQMMDHFGKTTTMNSAINRAKSLSKDEFSKKYGEYYGEDTDKLYNDIKNNDNTELTRFFAFNELSEFQPISMSEMPLSYLTAGNGRIFYMLKSFNIKALNVIYRESVHKWRVSNTKKEKANAAKDVGKLILLMTMAGASADELKDFLLAKDGAGSFSDKVMDNLLKISFASRYSLTKGLSGKPLKTILKDVLLPPTNLIDDTLSDISRIVHSDKKNDLSVMKSLPWMKLPYSWLSPVEEEKDMSNLKREVLNDFGSGDSLSKVRKRMNKYNAWARKTRGEKKPITFGTLTRARRRRRDNV